MFSYYLVFDVGGFLIPDHLHRINYIFRAITNRGFFLLIIQDIRKQELHMPIRILTTIWILSRQFLGLVGNYQGAVVASLAFAIIFGCIYF